MQESLESTKKPYSSPELKVYGSINDLTLGSSATPNPVNDGATGTYAPTVTPTIS